MIKNSIAWGLELITGFVIFGYNIEIGSGVYNWLSAFVGGGLFYSMMLYDDKTDNREAIRVAISGPALAVIFAPVLCEKYAITFDQPMAKAIYCGIAFCGLFAIKIVYQVTSIAAKELPTLVWGAFKNRFFPTQKKEEQ